MGTTVINKPPSVFKRNEYGLLEDESVNYEFNLDGTVNWRKMVKPEFLVANSDLCKKILKWVPKYDTLDVIIKDSLDWENKIK